MRPFTGTERHKHLQKQSFCTNIFNSLQVSTSDDFTWNLQSYFAECEFIQPLSNLSQLLIIAFKSSSSFHPATASSAPPHIYSFTRAILAERFYPSCLKSSAVFLSIRAHNRGFCPFPTCGSWLYSYIPNSSCCGLGKNFSISHIRYTLENVCPQTVQM